MPILKNAVTNILIGSVNITGIIYVADKPSVGSGPGGDLVSPRFVANTVQAAGITVHHSHCEVELSIDEEETAALYTPSPSPYLPGTPISTLVVTYKDNTLPTPKTKTVTYAGVYLKNVGGNKVENQAEHMPFTCTFLVTGTRVESAWS